MRDIFDIMKKDIRNKHINIFAELFHTDKRRKGLEDLIDTIMKAHHESPDKIQATASIEKNGYFIRIFSVDADMTEEVYDSIYSIYGGIIEDFKDNVELKLLNSVLNAEPIQWPNPVERTCFRDGVLGQWQEDALGDILGENVRWSSIVSGAIRVDRDIFESSALDGDGDRLDGFGSWRPANSSTWERIRNSEEHDITILDEFGFTVEDSDTLPIFNLDDFVIRRSDNERRIH